MFQQANDVENGHDMNNMMMDHMTDLPADDNLNMEQIPDSQTSQSEHEISQTYEGAPEMVISIQIYYLVKFCIVFLNLFQPSYLLFFSGSKGRNSICSTRQSY